MPVSILIPAFNEAPVIARVVAELRNSRPEDEILVIDDGSTDGTGPLARKAGARVLTHPENRGYGAALKTGIHNASHEAVVFFDGDGQHDPQNIAPLLQELHRHDMVVGARPPDSGILGRRSGKWILNRLANILVGVKIPDLNSGLRAIRRARLLQFLPLLPDGFSLTTTITLALLRSGYSVFYVPVSCRPRTGVSTVSPSDFFRTLRLILRMTLLFTPKKKSGDLSQEFGKEKEN